MLSEQDRRTLDEAERVCKQFKKGAYPSWDTVAHANLISFLETALRVRKELEDKIEDLHYEAREQAELNERD